MAKCRCGRDAEFNLVLRPLGGTDPDVPHPTIPVCWHCSVGAVWDATDVSNRHSRLLRKGYTITFEAHGPEMNGPGVMDLIMKPSETLADFIIRCEDAASNAVLKAGVPDPLDQV
jgi:hypothetical protein